MGTIFHVIKDPVHGTMQFNTVEDKWIKPFIDSPNFQRLRHIKQLGMGDLIFPGAVHTRFNHCLGCCYVGSQIAHKIGLSPAERQLVMIACLLHDVGHGPFSHTFEDLFIAKAIKHEDWTSHLLADYKHEEFFANYANKNPSYPLDDNKFTLISNMIMHLAGKNVMSDIVSSQLDADRLDYLLRDSHFCGVRYGEFDFKWMLHCLAVIETNTETRLGITHKGIGVVEHYLMARRLMMRNIYKSQKKIAIESLLVEMLSALTTEFLEKKYLPIQTSPLGRILLAIKKFNQAASKEKDLSLLKKSFLENNCEYYKSLSDYDVYALIRYLDNLTINDPAIEIAHRLQQRIMPTIVRLDSLDYQVLSDELKTFLQQHQAIPPWKILLIPTPHRSYTEEEPILVLDEKGGIRPITDYSLMIDALSDKYESSIFLSVDKTVIDDPRFIRFKNFMTKQP